MDVLRWVALKGVIGSGWRSPPMLVDVQQCACVAAAIEPRTACPLARRLSHRPNLPVDHGATTRPGKLCRMDGRTPPGIPELQVSSKRAGARSLSLWRRLASASWQWNRGGTLPLWRQSCGNRRNRCAAAHVHAPCSSLWLCRAALAARTSEPPPTSKLPWPWLPSAVLP